LTYRLIAAAVITSLSAVSVSFPAQALTSKECSAKYKAAQAAGTTGNLKYADYRKAECGTGASLTPTAGPVATPAPAPAAAPRTEPARTPTSRTAVKPPVASDAVFPSAISPKYSSEPAGRQRMHTCLDQYNANKATNANGGLKWIEKGGGYYSQCNSRLKS
jgi:hypothetical protein